MLKDVGSCIFLQKVITAKWSAFFHLQQNVCSSTWKQEKIGGAEAVEDASYPAISHSFLKKNEPIS